MHKAASLGFGIAKPWGRYRPLRFRSHLEATPLARPGKVPLDKKTAYRLMACGFKDRPYTAEQIDFLVVYLGAEALCYVMPISAVVSRILYLAPRSHTSRYVQYTSQYVQYIDA